MRVKFLILLSLTLLSVACAPSKSPRAGGETTTFSGTTSGSPKPAFKAETTQVPIDWKPDDVEVTCAADKCPLQVGALMFAGKPANGTIPIRRCTAFLVSSDTIMSNGHCDGFGKDKGYFVSQRINGEKEVREVTAVPYKRFTPHPKGETVSSGRPDVAFFTLNRPLRGIPPLRLASGPQMIFKKLIVFAIMHSPSEKNLRLEKHECLVRRHEADFPYEMIESPDMIQAFGCRLEPGTSGSPMFAAGSDEVQAVLVGGVDPIKRAQAAREHLKRDLLIYEKHWSSFATNVRCLDYPNAKPIPCTVTSEEAAAKKFNDIQWTELQKLRGVRASAPEAPVQLRASPYQLMPRQDLRFEILHTPDCRRGQEPLRVVPFIIEQAKVQFDEWAMPKIQSLSQVSLNAEVKSITGTVYEMELAWPAPAGPYMSPELDLRKKWGGRFHIDLPICPR